jgi:hypothetical protein
VLQNNFFYAQNVVVRPVTYAAPPYDAIVEECLFDAAMVDRSHVFRGATAAERGENGRIFMENTAKMLDFDMIDVLQTSQYVFKHPDI